MSERGDDGRSKAQERAQEQALREMLRQREMSAARPAAPEGPPDLAEVFGKLFGLFKAVQDNSNARKRATSDAPAARLERWRAEVNSRLQTARARMEEIQTAQQPSHSPSSDASFEPPDEPAPRPRSERTPRSVEPLIPVSKRTRRAATRRGRLRQQLNDPGRIRELLLANELLGPPLSRRSRQSRQPG